MRGLIIARTARSVLHFWAMLLFALLFSGLMTVGSVESLHAAEFRGDTTITIDSNEVIDDDLFVSGETVTINGTVKGNLFTSGTTVTVNGTVEGSLFAGGRTVILNGVVEGSAYIGSYAFTMGEEAQIGHNLNYGGFSLTMKDGSQIGRSLYGGGYQFLLDGSVANDVIVGSGALELNGYVGGDVHGVVGGADESTPSYMPTFEGAVPAVAQGLRVSDNAEVVGDLSITVSSATAENVPPFYSLANTQLRWAMGEIIALFIIGLLFLYMRPTLLQNASTAAQSQPLFSLGIGFLMMLIAIAAVPIVIALLVPLAILGGWFTFGQLLGDIVGLGIVSLLFAVGVFLFTAGMLTKIIVAYSGGRLLVGSLVSGDVSRGPIAFLALAVGVIIYIALRMLPFGAGWFIGLLVTLIGLGALYLAIRGRSTLDVATEPVARGMMQEAPST